MSNSEERLRILKMIEGGQVSAEHGAQPRTLRVRVTNLASRRQTINVTIPVSLVGIGLKLGARLAPRIADANAGEIMRAIESGALGRIFEMQDLDEGERVEIFVE